MELVSFSKSVKSVEQCQTDLEESPNQASMMNDPASTKVYLLLCHHHHHPFFLPSSGEHETARLTHAKL
jgi:hypothetical protein